MGGDLNLKKSWHPNLLKNQRRVYDEERKALEERKQIDKLVRERQEERQIEELQKLQENGGGPRRLNRVEWMYTGSTTGDGGSSRPTEEMEGFLLGKRRIDTLLKEEPKELVAAAPKAVVPDTTRDVASKIRDDPLFAIKKREQEVLESLPVPKEPPFRVQKKSSDRRERRHEHRHRDHDRHSDRHGHHDRHSHSHHDRHRSDNHRDSHRGGRDRERERRDDEKDKAARLAAMQQDADSIETERRNRQEMQQRRDDLEREENDKRRALDQGRFASNLRRKKLESY